LVSHERTVRASESDRGKRLLNERVAKSPTTN
jgi:hypothetical protein